MTTASFRPTRWVLRVYDPKKARRVAVGQVDSGVLTCYPNPMLHEPPAWALSVEALELLQQEGVQRIIFVGEGGVGSWTTSVVWFAAKGFRFDRGHGAQVALPLDYFDGETSAEPA